MASPGSHCLQASGKPHPQNKEDKMFAQFLTKLNIEFTIQPSNDMAFRDMNTYVLFKKKLGPKFYSSFTVTVKNWERPRCSSVSGLWFNRVKLSYIHGIMLSGKKANSKRLHTV